MGGNVWEWNETVDINGDYHNARGGSFSSDDFVLDLSSSTRRSFNSVYNEYGALGFRVASVPEPTTLLLFALGAAMLRKRQLK